MEPRTGENVGHSPKENIFHGGDVTSTISQMHKQGYLGVLHEKLKGELFDLLERQNKILNNKNFIDKLPDKGEKVRKFVAELKDRISSLENQERRDEEEKSSDDVKIETDNEDENPAKQKQDNQEEDLKIIERGFGNLSVHEGPHYQVVVKAENREAKKSRFLLNRNVQKDPFSAGKRAEAGKERDLTSASIHEPSHGPAHVISVNECRHLYSDHQEKMQEYRADQLSDRVLRRYRMFTPAEHPEGQTTLKDDKVEEVALEENYLDTID